MGWDITDEFAAEWNRIREKVDSVTGSGVHNTPTSISHAAESQPSDTKAQQPITRLKIIGPIVISTSNAVGRYTANPFYGATNNNPTNLSSTDLGTLSSNIVEVWNFPEIPISSASPQPSLAAGDFVLGTLGGFNSVSGYPIYHIEAPGTIGTAKVATLWSTGSTTLSCYPCTPAGVVTPSGASTFNITIEWGTAVPQFCAYAVNDVVGYVTTSDGVNHLLMNKLPTMTAQYMGWYNNNYGGGANIVADYLRAV